MKYQEIRTYKGIIYFEPIHFDLNRKPINKKIAKENLFILKKVLDKNNIPFTLAYGTLLGAIRESDFISHDKDVDIAVLDEYRKKLLESLFEFMEEGFIIGRYEKDLLSIVRKGEYIDIYIFKKYFYKYRKFNDQILREKYLLKTIEYKFLGKYFRIPKDYIGYLEELYGKNWKIPIKNMHPSTPTFFAKVKSFLKKKFPKLYKYYTILKVKYKK